MAELRIIRVLSNNAVLAAGAPHPESGARPANRVIVDKGIGFGRKVGDQLPETSRHPEGKAEYIELSQEHEDLLQYLGDIHPRLLEVTSASIDLAVDILGPLHPSVYVILSEHLSFAIERTGRGEVIRSTLISEMKAAFPAEFFAASLVLDHLNAQLGSVQLPEDEATFIALHLRAARTGETVKRPLETANTINRARTLVENRLRVDPRLNAEPLSVHLTFILRRLREDRMRTNAIASTISASLPVEMSLAEDVIRILLNATELPADIEGEAAFLAVFLHGCRT
ncbi:PRD domain-containing protein [Corynebacterium sp. H128]|uniref:PRD domain-containing protein n=1 Tax=unclassified Corynebacterium TaxID=2624378 RepID=UPI00309A4427